MSAGDFLRELPALLKALPDVLKAASATELSLAAFFFLLGVVLIAYLMRDTKAGWRFGALALWFVAAVILFVLLVGLPKSAGYHVRVSGQDTDFLGTTFALDLGQVAAGQDKVIALEVRPDANQRSFRIASVEAPLAAKWEPGDQEADLSREQTGHLVLRAATGAVGERQTREVRIAPTTGHLVPPLVLKVSLQAVDATKVVDASSGPRASGRGKDYSGIYSVCTAAPAPGDYILATSETSLSGDRSCGAWSTCTPRRSDDGKAACLDFTLQGHDECLGPFSHCNPAPTSEGHVHATYHLREPSPRLQPLD